MATDLSVAFFVEIAMTPEMILEYWFGELDPASEGVPREAVARWFRGGEAVDTEIRERFGDAVEEAHAGGYSDWCDTARGRLALVVLIDQFSRNVYRNDARAFAADSRTAELVVEGIKKRVDKELHPAQRIFFYMPLEHSEDRIHQAMAVGLMTAIADDVSDEASEAYSGFISFAVRHQRVIERFGRFPHRNAVLGRKTTPEEAEFLASPGAPF